MDNSSIDYQNYIDAAMRRVVRDVLKDVQKNGLKSEHHFFVTFQTNHPGVTISETLKARYPDEMTIVVQHQFWDLKIEEKGFGITLSFNNIPEKLYVPYASMTSFADPSVKFGLHFSNNLFEDFDEYFDEDIDIEELEEEFMEAANAKAEEQDNSSGPAEVISLDNFRKKS